MHQQILTINILREFLEYDPVSGSFIWLPRPGNETWNAQRANRRAGRVSATGYRRIGLFGRYYRAHRLAWLYVHGEWPADEIDHIDGNRDNNSISNLRISTRAQNAANRRKREGSSSFKGVHWHAQTGKWQASVKVKGKRTHLGLFDTEADAAEAYEYLARRLHGEFFKGA